MTWTGNRLNERFSFTRVEWPSLHELGSLRGVTGGSAELSAFTTVKATCSIECHGDAPRNGELVRVSYEYDGIPEPVVIGTFLPVVSDRRWTTENGRQVQTCTVEGSSVLSVAAQRVAGVPMAFSAGVDAIAAAKSLLESLMLTVDAPSEKKPLGSAKSFDPDATYLEICNGLLSSVGYASASPTPTGRVVFEPYAPPDYSRPAWVFENGKDSIVGMAVNESTNLADAPNAVRLWFEDDTMGIGAWALGTSGSMAALDMRGGIESTEYEGLSEEPEIEFNAAVSLALDFKDTAEFAATVAKYELSVPWSSKQDELVRRMYESLMGENDPTDDQISLWKGQFTLNEPYLVFIDFVSTSEFKERDLDIEKTVEALEYSMLDIDEPTDTQVGLWASILYGKKAPLVAQAMEAQAAEKLRDNTSDIAYCEIDHFIVSPVRIGSAIRISKNGSIWEAQVTNQSYSFEHGFNCTTKARNFADSGMDIETGSEVVWHV